MAVFECFGGSYNSCASRKPHKRKERLPLKQKFSHGVGHIYNDLTANAWFSYLIIFLTKVAGLSNAYAGLVILLGQITDATCTPFSGYLNDRTVNRYGRRKTWHLIGTACSTIAFPLLFNRCIGCRDSSEATKFAYYSICGCALQFGWGCVQVSHLSLIPEISKSASERVELNAIRWVYTPNPPAPLLQGKTWRFTKGKLRKRFRHKNYSSLTEPGIATIPNPFRKMNTLHRHILGNIDHVYYKPLEMDRDCQIYTFCVQCSQRDWLISKPWHLLFSILKQLLPVILLLMSRFKQMIMTFF